MRFSKVALGGTFDSLHSGHIVLLFEAMKHGDKVLIGVTSDAFAQKYKQYKVRNVEERLRNLEILLTRELGLKRSRFELRVIDDPYGPAISDPELDAIVVSIETYSRSLEINELRISRGLPPLTILIVPIIKDGYGNKLSSTMVRQAYEK
ncbi:MAG: pantetheine-phosphate adenylyltransferase [Thermocladium sp.]|jgi:pantetheine-phosphate adenylyltransferase